VAPSSGRAAGVSDTEVVFGMASPFSGAIKELGRGMRTGLEAAFAVANESGGVHGRKLKLVALDDGYDPQRTRQVMQELLEQRKVFAIAGNVGSPTAAVSVPIAMEKKVVFFGALTGAPLLRRSPPDRYVFNYRPSYAEETAAAVRYLVDVRRVEPRQIGVFYQGDAFGEAGLAGVEDQLRRYRRDPAQLVKATYQRNSADVSAALARFRKEQGKLRAVVLVATYQAAIQFIQRAKDAGLDLVFTNVSAVGSNELADGLVGAGAGYTSDVVVTQIVPLPTSKATAALRYQAALDKHAIGEKPGFITFEGYIVGNILIEALRRAGRDLDNERLVAAFEDIKGLDLGIGTPITFGPADHQGSHKVWGTQLQPDGSYKAIDLE
jgi:ABC-type branched-subunit amino acid transport system substrate-binding protein